MTILIGWKIDPAVDDTVLMRLDYADNDLEFYAITVEGEEPRAIQLTLSLKQCNELAETLLERSDPIASRTPVGLYPPLPRGLFS